MNYMPNCYDFKSLITSAESFIGRLNGFDALSTGCMVRIYNSQLFFGFYVLDCLKASSLRHVIFLQKLFKSRYL